MSLRGLFSPWAGVTPATIAPQRRKHGLVPGKEDFSVTIDGRIISLRICRNAQAKRLRLRYDSAADLLRLTIPSRANIRNSCKWVEQQHEWIGRQISKHPPPMVIGPDGVLPWRGSSLHIAWSPKLPRLPVHSDRFLYLGGPQQSIGRRVQRWLMDQARAEFVMMTEIITKRAGLSFTSVAVGDARSRWGSCSSSGRLRYNWRLIMAPEYVREAIVAHEVAHLAHMHHGPTFHALVDKLVGKAMHDDARRWLKVNGAALHGLRFDGVVPTADPPPEDNY